MEVIIEDPKHFGAALKQFTAMIKKSGLIHELRERESYSKPSERKKVKRSKAAATRARAVKAAKKRNRNINH